MTNILSTVKKKRKRRAVAGFMGTFVPKSLADYITLYCNAFEITKISILKDLLTAWAEKNMKYNTPEQLESKIALKSYAAWTVMEGKSFTTFIGMLKFELKKKKLERSVVERIIKLVENEKNANS